MSDLRQIVKELRFAAEYGCDVDLIERAADALQEAAEMIERSETEKSGTTVYMRMLNWTSEEERRIAEDIMNRSSPDRIVMLPSNIEILNPEELVKVCKEMLGVASPSETIRDHANKVIVPEMEAFLGRMENCIGQVIQQETKEK